MEVKLLRAGIEDVEELYAMQIRSFRELLDKYQDFDTSPGCEPIDKIEFRLRQEFTYYYFICLGESKVGAIRIVDRKEAGVNKRISPIFILPEYRGQKIAQRAIRMCEEVHGSQEWELETILQEQKNCYLYEKMGYRRTGEERVVNDKLTLIFYAK